jgi:hypothetical protein
LSIDEVDCRRTDFEDGEGSRELEPLRPPLLASPKGESDLGVTEVAAFVLLAEDVDRGRAMGLPVYGSESAREREPPDLGKENPQKKGIKVSKTMKTYLHKNKNKKMKVERVWKITENWIENA